jgi:hypothetical protein
LGEEIFKSADESVTDEERAELNKAARAKFLANEKEAIDNDANHYLVLVFTTTSKLNAFQKELRIPPTEQYVDGERVAGQLGIGLE